MVQLKDSNSEFFHNWAALVYEKRHTCPGEQLLSEDHHSLECAGSVIDWNQSVSGTQPVILIWCA